MGNYLKKKNNAKTHNSSLEIINNLLYVGQCECGGELFMYLKSQEENIYNIYCSKCVNRLNFKHIDEYDQIHLFFLPSAILNTLKQTYGEEVIERTYGD
jgi:hypothetical protein